MPTPWSPPRRVGNSRPWPSFIALSSLAVDSSEETGDTQLDYFRYAERGRRSCDHCLTGDTLKGVDTVSVRELRNSGGDVLRRVELGERVVITRDGTPVAELRPLPRSSAAPAELIRRRKTLPSVDPDALRRDIDDLIDPAL